MYLSHSLEDLSNNYNPFKQITHPVLLGVGVGRGERGGMRRKRHQTRSKIINRLNAEH